MGHEVLARFKFKTHNLMPLLGSCKMQGSFSKLPQLQLLQLRSYAVVHSFCTMLHINLVPTKPRVAHAITARVFNTTSADREFRRAHFSPIN
jgi:hypothetical protein